MGHGMLGVEWLWVNNSYKQFFDGVFLNTLWTNRDSSYYKANALENGETLAKAMQCFYDERNYLASLYDVSPAAGEPKPKRSRKAA